MQSEMRMRLHWREDQDKSLQSVLSGGRGGRTMERTVDLDTCTSKR